MFRNIWPISKLYDLSDRVYQLQDILSEIEAENNEIRDDAINKETEMSDRVYQLQNILSEIEAENNKIRDDAINKEIEIKKLKLQIMQLQNNYNELINIIDFEKAKYLEQNNLLNKKIKAVMKDLEQYKWLDQINKKQMDEDIWITKYGYDWMLSDLQMSYIEKVVPGNRKRLLNLKESHIGESCFIIGNGPSLKIEDLDELKKKKIFCFGAKRINLIFDQTDWRPDIWGASDLDYIDACKDEINEFDDFIKLVCAQSIIKNDTYIDNVIYYPFIQMERRPPWFNKDIMRGVHFWGTITCKLINFAVYMGFKKIYLLGVDNSYAVKINEKGKYEYDIDKVNHFTDKYLKQVERVNILKNIDDMVKAQNYVDESYKSIKWHCEQLEVEIINATRGGELEIFSRCDFEKIMNAW